MHGAERPSSYSFTIVIGGVQRAELLVNDNAYGTAPVDLAQAHEKLTKELLVLRHPQRMCTAPPWRVLLYCSSCPSLRLRVTNIFARLQLVEERQGRRGTDHFLTPSILFVPSIRSPARENLPHRPCSFICRNGSNSSE